MDGGCTYISGKEFAEVNYEKAGRYVNQMVFVGGDGFTW
jgi:hypothetical protein